MSFTWTRGAADPTFRASSAGPATLAATTAVTDPAAAQVRAKVGDLLVRLYGYLAANAEQHPALATAIPALSSAVAEYRTGQAADPYDGVRAVLARINAIRAADPSIPAS
jgi:hypothetical protein